MPGAIKRMYLARCKDSYGATRAWAIGGDRNGVRRKAINRLKAYRRRKEATADQEPFTLEVVVLSTTEPA